MGSMKNHDIAIQLLAIPHRNETIAILLVEIPFLQEHSIDMNNSCKKLFYHRRLRVSQVLFL